MASHPELREKINVIDEAKSRLDELLKKVTAGTHVDMVACCLGHGEYSTLSTPC